MLPTGMIVILSWVGFWIDYRATPARCSLAITTVLTITTLTNSIRASLPHVGHIKSIDVYLLSCFFFVFASTIEFAITGVTDRRWLKLYERKQENNEVSKNKYKYKQPLEGRTFSCHVYTALSLYKNAYLNLRFCETINTTQHKNARKRRFTKTPFKVDIYQSRGFNRPL